MPDQYGDYERQNRTRIPLPTDLDPSGSVCIQLTLPDDEQWLAAFWLALHKLSSQQSWARDEAHTAKDVAAKWRDIIRDAGPCVARRNETNNGVELELECDDMVSITIYEGCGCGEAGTGSGAGGSGISVTKSEADKAKQISEIVQSLNAGAVVTVCDWVTGGGTAYVLDQYKESLNFYKNIATGGTVEWIATLVNTLSAGFSDIVTKWVDTIQETGFDPAIAMMDDAQFQRAYQQAWVAHFGGTAAPQAAITRADLNAVALRLGIASFGTGTLTFPSLTVQVLSQIADLNDINLFRVGLNGSGNQAICQQLSELAGVTYIPPVLAAGNPNPIPGETVNLSGQYRAVRQFNGDLNNLNSQAWRSLDAPSSAGALGYAFLVNVKAGSAGPNFRLGGYNMSQFYQFQTPPIYYWFGGRVNNASGNDAMALFAASTDEALNEFKDPTGMVIAANDALAAASGTWEFRGDASNAEGQVAAIQVWRIEAIP